MNTANATITADRLDPDQRLCPACDGVGQTEHECEDCDGYGCETFADGSERFDVPAGWTCGTCDGDGVIRRCCPTCGSQGWIDAEEIARDVA